MYMYRYILGEQKLVKNHVDMLNLLCLTVVPLSMHWSQGSCVCGVAYGLIRKQDEPTGTAPQQYQLAPSPEPCGNGYTALGLGSSILESNTAGHSVSS